MTFAVATLPGVWPVFAAVFVALLRSTGVMGETYTTNAICLKHHCINPVFPGLEDLDRLEDASWQCSTLRTVSKAMRFCKGAVTYDPALPVLDITDIDNLTRKQDAAAATMFHYHLAGMGMEGWDYPDPSEADDCVKTVWKMACYTYFPRAKMGCQEGYATLYMRPCQSSCQNYIKACSVECCDESVQCVFSHTKHLSSTVSFTQRGYVPHDGPSSLCTGASGRRFSLGSLPWFLLAVQGALLSAPADLLPSAAGLRRSVVALSLAGMAVFLQGCDVDVPTHNVGNWRAEPDYLMKYEFVPPGGSSRAGLLNSCSLRMLSPTVQCGGRGVCKLRDNTLDSPVAFCQCKRDWADPECTTRRKSQVVAYLLAVFTGPFGGDLFYLGFKVAGTMKLATLGGFGLWWIWDIIRIGSSPVLAKNFRVAADFPHWAFVLSTVSLALLVGFAVSYVAVSKHIMARRKAVLMLQSLEEHHLGGHDYAVSKLAGWGGGASGYGSTGNTVGAGGAHWERP